MDETKLTLAMKTIPRENFLPERNKQQADIDTPMAIGHGQTNSQPTTVKMMLQWLDPQVGDKILDVGSGSGWTSGLLSYLAGDSGMVYAVEKVPELLQLGRENCEALGIDNVEFYPAADEIGLSSLSPYDRILVSAAAETMPKELLEQLRPGGKMVIPVKQTVYEIDKLRDSTIKQTPHPGFSFVPLVS